MTAIKELTHECGSPVEVELVDTGTFEYWWVQHGEVEKSECVYQ